MSRRSLLFKLLALAGAAAVVPALIITVAQRSISSHSLQAAIQQRQTELARRVAGDVDNEIRSAQRVLAFAAQSPVWRNGSTTDQRHAFANALRAVPAFQNIMLVDASGQERLNLNRDSTSSPRMWRSAHLGGSYVGAPFFSGNGLPTILLGEPLDRRSGGVLMAKMSFSELGGLMAAAHIGGHGLAFIVDQQGELIAHPDEERVRAHANFSDLPVVKDWRSHPNEPSELREYSDERNVPALAVAYPIPLLRSVVVVQQPRAEVYAPLLRMRNQFLFWTGFGLFFFMGLALAVAWRILQPLRQLQRAAETIGHGQWDVELKIETHDELEDLAGAFGKMADSLRALETMRQDLINMIVHDLKSPLSTITASLDFLSSGDLGDLTENQQKFIGMSRRSGQELLAMIQTLLDVAKMDEGKLTLQRESFAPLPWAEKTVGPFRPIAESSRKQLNLTASESLPAADGDVALLARVLSNLLSNALRHTRQNSGIVSVFLQVENGALQVAVQDNGEGIPEEQQAAIFKKFVQAEGAHQRAHSGTGLGLTFCKMVVEAHGGAITVRSAPGQGSTFTFTVPLAQSASVETKDLPEAMV